MGTRSLTRVYEDGQLLVQFYRQYDGYPSGMGADLAEYLTGGKAVNGIGGDAKLHKTWNGAGCLAASLIAHFKDSVGNIYIAPPKKSVDMWQEFEYEIHVNGPVVLLDVFKSGSKKPLYHGDPADLLKELRKDDVS